MKDLLQILKQQNKEQDFDAIRVGLASKSCSLFCCFKICNKSFIGFS